MPMDGAGLGTAVIAALTAEFDDEYANLPNSHTLSGYDKATYDARYWNAVGVAIVNYIKANAKATGTDTPSGDSHNLAIV